MLPYKHRTIKEKWFLSALTCNSRDCCLIPSLNLISLLVNVTICSFLLDSLATIEISVKRMKEENKEVSVSSGINVFQLTSHVLLVIRLTLTSESFGLSLQKESFIPTREKMFNEMFNESLPPTRTVVGEDSFKSVDTKKLTTLFFLESVNRMRVKANQLVHKDTGVIVHWHQIRWSVNW